MVVADKDKASNPAASGEDGKSKKALKKEAKDALKQAKKQAGQEGKGDAGAAGGETEVDVSAGKYGDLELNASQTKTVRELTRVSDINETLAGSSVLVRARLHTSRGKRETNFCCFSTRAEHRSRDSYCWREYQQTNAQIRFWYF